MTRARCIYANNSAKAPVFFMVIKSHISMAFYVSNVMIEIVIKCMLYPNLFKLVNVGALLICIWEEMNHHDFKIKRLSFDIYILVSNTLLNSRPLFSTRH